MKVSTIRSEGLAHLSYLVSSDEDAFVIDPRRDCDIYLRLAEKQGVTIMHILETHRNEDYVIGSVELQNRVPSARIGHSSATSFHYGEDNLEDEDSFKIGDVHVTCLHTPVILTIACAMEYPTQASVTRFFYYSLRILCLLTK
ncbi:MAG: hypothetical protein ACW98Y_18315 [Candidatus Thorarchaeota archaeon]